MKETYTDLEMEVITFDIEDVITTSYGENPGGGGTGGGGGDD